jgi:type IV pilus assembly protein PilC
MLFSRRLPLPALIEFTRVLRHNLAAGISLRRVFQQQAERGPPPVRPVAQRISHDLEQGKSLEKALKKEKAAFPPLFIALVTVGEESGNVPEILGDVEKYFLLQQRLWREFFSQIAWPMVIAIVAPFIIAGMLWILSILGSGFNPLPGYTATSFLVQYFGSFAILIAAYFVLTQGLKQKAAVHEILLRLPAFGPALMAIVMTRFCIALRLTMETGMSILTAVRLSMEATGNAAYPRHFGSVQQPLKAGEDLAESLGECRLFPTDFLNIVANAEEGGRVPEVMRLQAEYYEDEARRKMTTLTRFASWGIYAAVAVVLMIMIFSVAISVFGNGGAYDPARYGISPLARPALVLPCLTG